MRRELLLLREADRIRRPALLWHFTVLGEAASQVPSGTKDSHPEIAWRAATRLRNRIVHGYWDIDVETLVAATSDDISGMITQLDAAITSLEELGEHGDPDPGARPASVIGEDVLPESWHEQLHGELEKEYWSELLAFVAKERRDHDVFPPSSETFAAFEFTPYEAVRVVILGQDLYPNPGEAHGLAFSVRDNVRVPPSLRNIHKELNADLGVPVPSHGRLDGWARQGVLLLNTALTVRAGDPADRKSHRDWRHQGAGWRTFTDAVISAVSAKEERVVFILWGVDAKAKQSLIDASRHTVLVSAHPSPPSANQGGFFGTRSFSEANQSLAAAGRGEIDWSRFRAAA